jgi:hypothetical protein
LSKKSESGLVATVAIVALLIIVIGVGIINFTSASGGTITQTSLVTENSTLATTVRSTVTQSDTLLVNNTITKTQVSTQTLASTTKVTVTSISATTVTQNSVGTSQISVTSIVLYGGVAATNTSQPTSSLQISFNNQNSPTYITSLILQTPSGVQITAWDNSPTVSSARNQIVFSSNHPGENSLGASSISFFTFYPAASTADPILAGGSFQYSILFASGSLIEGNITAQ